MEVLYALSLVVSLVAGSASMLLGLAAHFSLRGASPRDGVHPGAPRASRLVRHATDLFAVGGVVGLSAFVVHWGWEHGARSVAPMTAGAFASSHPSFLMGVLLSAGGSILVLAARARIANRGRMRNAA